MTAKNRVKAALPFVGLFPRTPYHYAHNKFRMAKLALAQKRQPPPTPAPITIKSHGQLDKSVDRMDPQLNAHHEKKLSYP